MTASSQRDHTETVKVLLAVPGIDVNVKDEVRKQLIVVDCTHRALLW